MLNKLKKSILLCGLVLAGSNLYATELCEDSTKKKRPISCFLGDKYTDSAWGATGGPLFDGVNSFLVKLAWNNTIGRLFGEKGPDPYMVALHDIQASLDRIEAKTDTIIGVSQVTFFEIQAFQNQYLKDQSNQHFNIAMELPEQVEEKSQRIFLSETNVDKPLVNMNQYTIDGEINADALFDMALNTCGLNQDGVVKCTTRARQVIDALDGKVPIENRVNADDVLNEIPDQAMAKGVGLDGNSLSGFITKYSNINFNSSAPEQTKLNAVNDDMVTLLGTKGYSNNKDMHIPVQVGESDITTRWFSANSVLQSLATRYYSSLYSLYQLQAVQLAYYYAYPQFFDDGAVNRSVMLSENSEDKDVNQLDINGRKALFKKALDEKMDVFFRSKITENFVTVFGSGPENLGSMYKDIPNLTDFVKRTLNNNKLVFPKECSITGLTMPVQLTEDNEYKDQYYLGRLNMQCYFNNEDVKEKGKDTVYYTVNVGRDMPYFSPKAKDGKYYINLPDNFFAETDGQIKIGFKSVLNGSDDTSPSRLTLSVNKSQSGFNDFYQWLPDMEYDVSGKPTFKYKQKTDSIHHTNEGIGEYFPIPAQNSSPPMSNHEWVQYQGYGYNYSGGTNDDSLITYLLTSSYNQPTKGSNVYARKSGVYSYKNELNFHYCPSQAQDWHGSNNSKETDAWMAAQLLYIQFNGHYFMISNQFPKTYVDMTTAEPWYAQFTRPVCFKTPNNNGLCETVPFDYGDRFKKIYSQKYYGIANTSVQDPKVAVKFEDGTQVGVSGKLFGRGAGNDAQSAKNLPLCTVDGRVVDCASTFNLITKIPPVYQFYTGEAYNNWLKGPEDYLSRTYLDGSTVLLNNHEDQVIVKNKDYKLVYTPTGSIEVIDKDGNSKTSLKYVNEAFGGNLQSDKLMLSNGDLLFIKADGTVQPLLQTLYKHRGHSSDWVNDPYARLELTDKGQVVVKSWARPFIPQKSKLKAGLNGVLYNSAWEANADNKGWPTSDNGYKWLSEVTAELGEWVGENKSASVQSDSMHALTGTLIGCFRNWWEYE